MESGSSENKTSYAGNLSGRGLGTDWSENKSGMGGLDAAQFMYMQSRLGETVVDCSQLRGSPHSMLGRPPGDGDGSACGERMTSENEDHSLSDAHSVRDENSVQDEQSVRDDNSVQDEQSVRDDNSVQDEQSLRDDNSVQDEQSISSSSDEDMQEKCWRVGISNIKQVCTKSSSKSSAISVEDGSTDNFSKHNIARPSGRLKCSMSQGNLEHSHSESSVSSSRACGEDESQGAGSHSNSSQSGCSEEPFSESQDEDKLSFGGALLHLIKEAHSEGPSSLVGENNGSHWTPDEKELRKQIESEAMDSVRHAISEQEQIRQLYEKALNEADEDEPEEESGISGTAYLCPMCEKSFSTLSSLSTHLRNHTADKPYQCGVCDKSFGQQMDLERHSLIHSSDLPYPCTMCDQRFSQRQQLYDHVQEHTDEKEFRCKVCHKSFVRKTAFEKHLVVHASPGEKPDQSYDPAALMLYLTRKHIRGTPYDCTMCTKSFSQKVHLDRHILTHTGQKPFKCQTCGKSFAQKSTLQRHEMCHSGVRTYRCDICDKMFAQGGDLTRHSRTHTGEKPYPCDVCDKSFAQACVLQRHKLTHLREKPHECHVCAEKFSSLKALARHRKEHRS